MQRIAVMAQTSVEWDPFADPAEESAERPVAQEAAAAAPEEQSGGSPFCVGRFVQVAVLEGPHSGAWIACQILSKGESDETYNIFIPSQPPIVDNDVELIPNVPEKILRQSLAPADPLRLSRHYPVPRVPRVPAAAPTRTWYQGKPVVTGRKLRVLGLHGTSSNLKIFTSQISPLRVACKDKVDFLFTQGSIDASKIPNNPQYELMSKIFPGHDFFQFANYAEGNGNDYSDLDKVMETIQKFMKDNAPIDGVIGTGQGSNISTLLAAQAAIGEGMPLCFAIHHGGTGASWTWRFPDLFGEQLRIPSLHITGKQDPFLHGHHILAHLYANPETINHSEDHRPYPRNRAETAELTAKVLGFMERAVAAEGVN